MNQFAPTLRRFSLLSLAILTAAWGAAAMATPAQSADTAIPTETVRLTYFGKPSPAPSGMFSVSAVSAADDDLRIPEEQDSMTYTTETYAPGLDMTMFGVKLLGENFEHTNEHGVAVSAHFTGADGARDYDLHSLSGHAKAALPTTLYVTEPIPAEGVSSYQVTITLYRNTDGTSPVVSDLEIISLDSSIEDLPEPTAGFSVMAAEDTTTDATTLTTTATPEIISRTSWGADENYRYNSDGDELWPQEIEQVKTFIVHHTAGGDGGSSPAATVRGIYYWHAQVLGWGDIGYNYLIDKDGNIYKGRKGSDGVVGAHTYNSVDNINYNEGSIGIALLGCYDEEGCDSIDEISEEMEAALVELIGYKAAELNIKPKSTVTFHGNEAKRIGGHQDFDYTLCPGNTVLGDMTGIRDAAQAEYDTYTALPLQAELTDVTVLTTPVSDGEQATAVDATALATNTAYTMLVTYQNTGTESWAQADMNLRMLKKSGRGITKLRHKKSWPHRYGKVTMTEQVVAPGEPATFSFRIRAHKKARSRTMTLKLYAGTDFVIQSKNQTSVSFVAP